MRPIKLELPKEDLDSLRILGKMLANDTKFSASQQQKKLIAGFLVKCIGNFELNKSVFKNKGKLVEMGIDVSAINAILDLTFCTRNAKNFAAALVLFQSKERSALSTLEIIRNYAYLHNYHILHITLATLQNHDVLCDEDQALSGLYDQCNVAKKIAEAFEAEAKKPGFKVGLYGKSSAHHEILVLFQRINSKYGTQMPRNDQTRKG